MWNSTASSGVAAIAAGIVLLVLDGKATCANNDVSHDMPCAMNYKTKAGGFAALGAGVAAGAIGGTILLTAPTTHDGRVAPAGGWYLAWKGAF